MELIPILKSEDVKYGQPQYFVKQDGDTSTQEADRIGLPPRHAVLFRSKDPKPLPKSDPRYGLSGTIHLQDAFDRTGHLRHGTCEMAESHPGHCDKLRGWPVEERGGLIYSMAVGSELANEATAIGGLRFPALRPVPSLTARTQLALESELPAGLASHHHSAAAALPAGAGALLSQELAAAYDPSTPTASQRSSWGTERTRTPTPADGRLLLPPHRATAAARRARDPRTAAAAAAAVADKRRGRAVRPARPSPEPPPDVLERINKSV